MVNIMDDTSYGRAAFKKFGAVPDGFHIFRAGWIGKEPKDWKTMQVTGAQWDGKRRVPGTTMTTIVTIEEMRAADQDPQS